MMAMLLLTVYKAPEGNKLRRGWLTCMELKMREGKKDDREVWSYYRLLG